MNPFKFILSFLNTLLFARLYIRGKVYPGFIPSKDDLVIDLGSGDKPFWRADVYLDKEDLGNEQRFSSEGVIKNISLFIDSDITKTPFKEKTFDFSYCSHVLEHVERPDLAIKEIMRISKKGYIEVPIGMAEMIYPYQSHLWFVFLIKKQLVFVRKSKNLHKTLEDQGNKYLYLGKLMPTPVIHYYWKSKINYKIIDDLKPSEKFVTTKDIRMLQPLYVQKIAVLLGKVLRTMFYKNKKERLETMKLQLKIKENRGLSVHGSL